MSIINRINRLVSCLWGIFLLFYTVFAFNKNAITVCEMILLCLAINSIYWIICIKWNFFIKSGVVLITTLLIHLAFININLDMKYLYQGTDYCNTPSLLYVLFGLCYVYCLFQQWILLLNHIIKQAINSEHRYVVMDITGCFFYIFLAMHIDIMNTQFCVYFIPIIHYLILLIVQYYLKMKNCQ